MVHKFVHELEARTNERIKSAEKLNEKITEDLREKTHRNIQLYGHSYPGKHLDKNWPSK